MGYHRRDWRPSERRGSVAVEFVFATPIVILAAAIVIQMTFDTISSARVSAVATEAAREGARVFPATLPFFDPEGEPSRNPTDNDDVIDRLAAIVAQRLGRGSTTTAASAYGKNGVVWPNLWICVRRGGQVAERGDYTLATPPPTGVLLSDEVEVTVVLRVQTAPKSASTVTASQTLPPQRYGVLPVTNTVRSTARAIVE